MPEPEPEPEPVPEPPAPRRTNYWEYLPCFSVPDNDEFFIFTDPDTGIVITILNPNYDPDADPDETTIYEWNDFDTNDFEFGGTTP
jgi:hypothetical protein